MLHYVQPYSLLFTLIIFIHIEKLYQLGFPSASLPGDALMNIGLPIKFYTFDDSVMFLLT